MLWPHRQLKLSPEYKGGHQHIMARELVPKECQQETRNWFQQMLTLLMSIYKYLHTTLMGTRNAAAFSFIQIMVENRVSINPWSCPNNPSTDPSGSIFSYAQYWLHESNPHWGGNIKVPFSRSIVSNYFRLRQRAEQQLVVVTQFPCIPRFSRSSASVY